MTDPISSWKTSSATSSPPFPTHSGYICVRTWSKKAGVRSGWWWYQECPMLGAWLVGLSDKIPVPEPFISWVYCLKITLSHRLWFARNSQEEPASHRSVYLYTYTHLLYYRNHHVESDPNWYNVIHRAYNLLKIVCRMCGGKRVERVPVDSISG